MIYNKSNKKLKIKMNNSFIKSKNSSGEYGQNLINKQKLKGRTLSNSHEKSKSKDPYSCVDFDSKQQGHS